MNLKLIVAKGEPRGKEVEITKAQTVIGRDPASDLVIASAKISRKHCRIDVQGNAASVTDLGSRNGTLVNGKKVSKVALKAGDKVALGPLGFVVEIDGDRGAAPQDIGPSSATAGGIHDFLAGLEQGPAAGGDDVLKLDDTKR